MVFSLVASPLVKILLLVFIRSNKNRSYPEKVKYPLFITSIKKVNLNSVSFCSVPQNTKSHSKCSKSPFFPDRKKRTMGDGGGGVVGGGCDSMRFGQSII